MTEIMAPISNMSSTEDDDVAFKVLNNDNLPMAVIGESIRCPFGNDIQKTNKPNVVVYPTRRIVDNLDANKQKPFPKPNGINQRDNKSPSNQLKNYGNFIHCNSAKEKVKEKVINHQIDNAFTKTLDAKLKRLQKEENKTRVKRSTPSITNELQNRPLFVTTVKKGQFLEPPPEIASLLGIKVQEEKKDKKKLYEYASKPRVFLAKPTPTVKIGHKARCEAAAKAAALVVAVAGIRSKNFVDGKDFNANITKKIGDAPPPYANLMFERRVVRGSNFSQGPMQTGEGESAAARAAEARRRAMARRKSQKEQLRTAQLRLSSPPPVKGRRHETVETDLYLEELANDPPQEDVCTQTDLFLDRPLSPFYVPAKTGADVSTQIYPGDLFDFDMEVQPILEVLVGKTIEQALIEVLEEEELAALKEQQRRFMELRATQLAEMMRLEEREKRWQAERDARLAEYKEGLSVQKEMEERIAASVLLQGYMADLLPNVLEGLEEDGFLTDNIKQDLDETFMPWLMKEVSEELHEIVSSRDFLSDIVREILEARAEIYRLLNAPPKPIAFEPGEEEGTVDVDVSLMEHLKLKSEIAERQRAEQEEMAENK
nr:radial spoke head protein 3 homolog B [Onthophagus taurus]XP_022902700.1 radial spoke head protein 3 homolog B [Onthophagus taurus]